MAHESGFAALAVVSACVIVWGLVSGRLERWDVSAPIAFVVLGVVVTHGPTAMVHFTLHSSTIRSLAEVTLAIVLFADASRVNLRALRADAAIPVRLLGIGLPLTIAAGAATAAVLFGSTGLWVAAAIGAIVAPTDAALGASIMSDDRVPSGVRRTLNVESGLNDGIATPVVNLFIAGAVTADALSGQHLWAAVGALLGGTLLGIGIGIVGATSLAWARRHEWSSRGYRPLAILALAVFSYSAAYVAGVNGFVCAFVAGLAFGSIDHHNDEAVLGFAEEAGSLLSLVVWFLFGAVMLVPGLEDAGWRDVVFALLALTVLRMVPVAVALAGTGLDRATVAFVGWFGPRGLASVVFGLIAVDSLEPSQSKVILTAVTLTVALSVLLHGISASPLAARYGAYAAARLEHGHPAHGRAGGAAPIATRSLRRAGSAAGHHGPRAGGGPGVV
ncbi:MAG TPA: cation:proton antiporter [Acidimicrobiales bacterium]|jgi:NhaP-type Na+/H+ or K+/H+ antiporter|nr:cation:proton antiporter [Acidimicrobiales bacterium]